MKKYFWMLLFLSPLLLLPILVQSSPKTQDTQTQEQELTLSEEQISPKFKKGDCFQHNGMREPWESNRPDGIIAIVGYEKYLVIFRDEAEKRGEDKLAAPISFETMDRDFHKIACPPSWKDHTHEKDSQLVRHGYGTSRTKNL